MGRFLCKAIDRNNPVEIYSEFQNFPPRIVRGQGRNILIYANKLLESAVDLCENYSERCRIAGHMSEVVDGRETERNVKALV